MITKGTIYKNRSKLPSKLLLVTGTENVTRGNVTGFMVSGVAVEEGGAPRCVKLTMDEFTSTYPLIMWKP